jgi:4-azaleucine resistance transporter AzlC
MKQCHGQSARHMDEVAVVSHIETSRPIPTAEEHESLRAQFRRGFVDVLPLWPGMIPFSVALAILTRSSGFSALETQLLSMLVFAGAAHIAIIGLYAAGSSVAVIVITAIALNLRHILYGLSLHRHLRDDDGVPRSLVAWFLVDESYGLTIREVLAGRGGSAYLLGTGVSLYIEFSLSTLAGLLFGSFLPDPERIGLAFIFPLMFLALLLPLVRTGRAVAVAGCSGLMMLAMSHIVSSGFAFVVAAVTAAMLGAVLDGRAERCHV